MIIATVKGSGKKPYELKQDGPVFSCSCPAWRNQSLPIDKRTCKHLKAHLGETNELVRTASAVPGIISQLVARAAEKGRKLRPDEKAKLNGPPILLAHPWTPDIDPTGYWMSEKLDGVRAYWTGSQFLSRQGNVYHVPEWFKEGLPKDRIVDGELWMGRQQFQKTLSVVRSFDSGDAWKQIKYRVFDMPNVQAPFEDRNLEIASMISVLQPAYAEQVEQERCASVLDLRNTLDHYVDQGAEGLMLRKPCSLYEVGRSWTCLKVKNFFDKEAVVVGHTPGKGRHKGRCGALVVQMPDGKQFSLGTGLSDSERNNPPNIGATITYRYTELTSDGIPKCGSFVAERNYE